jgi:hypothetical protein
MFPPNVGFSFPFSWERLHQDIEGNRQRDRDRETERVSGWPVNVFFTKGNEPAESPESHPPKREGRVD